MKVRVGVGRSLLLKEVGMLDSSAPGGVHSQGRGAGEVIRAAVSRMYRRVLPNRNFDMLAHLVALGPWVLPFPSSFVRRCHASCTTTVQKSLGCVSNVASSTVCCTMDRYDDSVQCTAKYTVLRPFASCGA